MGESVPINHATSTAASMAHGANGLWGVLAVGLFAVLPESGDLVYSWSYGWEQEPMRVRDVGDVRLLGS